MVSYSLEGDEATAFYVTTVNSFGYIYVNASLDYDLKNNYNFTVSNSTVLPRGLLRQKSNLGHRDKIKIHQTELYQ